MTEASSTISIQDLYIFIDKLETALESGWIINLCQHLSVEVSDIYHFLNTIDHTTSQLDTTMCDETEREEKWITAYSEYLGRDNPSLTERDFVVLVNVIVLRFVKNYLLVNPVKEPHVLNLHEAVPHWGAEALRSVRPSPFQLGNFVAFSNTFLPDSDVLEKVVLGFRNGFKIGYEGPRTTKWGTSAVPEEPDLVIRVRDHLRKEIDAGRLIGPLPNIVPVYLKFVRVSPVRLIPKKSMGVAIVNKYRLIHNLSHGKISQSSVNDWINVENFELQYIRVDEVGKAMREAGYLAKIWKSDMVDAFRIAPMDPDDIPLLGISFEEQLYLESRLVFGVRSGPSIFSDIAGLVRDLYNGIILGHHLKNMADDYFYFSHRSNILAAEVSLAGFKDLMNLLGLDLSAEKTFTPKTKMVILGLRFNTAEQTISVPRVRRKALQTLLQDWIGRSVATKQEMQSLIGVLNFCCYAVRWGRAFIRRLIDAMASAHLQSDEILLDDQIRADIDWWVRFMKDWNGVSVLINWHPIDIEWHFYSDSSKPTCAGVWQDTWWHYDFTEADNDRLENNISCKELFAVVTHCATFGPRLAGATILLFCDNSASVDAITFMKASSRVMMSLVRELFFLCARFSFQIKAQHIPGVKNVLADALSRPEKRLTAWQVRPTLDRVPVAPVLPSLTW